MSPLRHTLLSFALLPLALLGQETPNDTLHWSPTRLLAAADFKQQPQDYTGMNGEAYCMVLANFERPSTTDSTTYHAVAIFDRSKSWIAPKVEQKPLLAYFQVMFDLYELHARKLKKSFTDTPAEGDPTAAFQARYNAMMTDLSNAFNTYRKETRMGQDPAQVAVWSKRVKEELGALSAYAER